VGEKGTVRVVVVIHDDFLRTQLARSLRRQAGIEVVGVARNGAGALSEVRRTLPDIVLMDVPMSPFGHPILSDQVASIELFRSWWIDKFTNESRRVMRLAQESATHHNHNNIGTEHVLLGLIREGDGIAAKALESLGISLSRVQEQVEAAKAGRKAPNPARVALTERAKDALEVSLQKAQQLGESQIDTEHILLGLIPGGGRAARILAKLGADPGRVHRKVLELLSGVPGATERHHWVTVLREVKDAFPKVSIVAFISDERVTELAPIALQAGASVYVLRTDPWERVADAVRVAANVH